MKLERKAIANEEKLKALNATVMLLQEELRNVREDNDEQEGRHKHSELPPIPPPRKERLKTPRFNASPEKYSIASPHSYQPTPTGWPTLISQPSYFPGHSPIAMYASPAAMYPGQGSPATPAAMYPGQALSAPPAAMYPGQALSAPPAAMYPGQGSPAPPAAMYPGQTPPAPPAAMYPGQYPGKCR